MKSAKTKFFVVYAIVLLASHLWVTLHDEGVVERGQSTAEATDQTVFVIWGRAGGSDAESRLMARELSRRPDALVWTPAAEEGDRPSELAARVDGSGARSVIVLGIGYGSVEALEFASKLGTDPGLLVLVSPVVSARFELLGDKRLNTAMKSFQLAWFWVFEKVVPHFGYSRHLPYNLATARRAFDADQEKAAEIYGSYSGPLQLWYSKSGSFVRSGALEAYLAVRPESVAIEYKELGEAIERTLAEERQWTSKSGPAVASQEFEDFPGVQLDPWWGGLLLAVSTLASEDFACIGGGLLAASGSIALGPAVIGCLLGIFIGDLGIYFIGRFFGAAALNLPVLRHFVSAKALNRSSEWFERRGVALVVLTRFFPGSRVPTYFAAGVVKVGWIRFAMALLLASAIWTPILVLASYFLGERFLGYFESMGVGGWLGIVAVIVCFGLGVRILSKLATWRGRRLLHCRWKRLICWEFWPLWAVYAPVLPQIAWLAIRYRSVSLPFSVNPCMPASGLVYESKIQILGHLAKSGVPVARFEAIELELLPEEKLRRLHQFMKRLGLDYPVVLKPDVGQRGQGVVIAHREEQAVRFFEKQEEDTIAQEYVEGAEYGVFYERSASQGQGQVTSITDKRTTWVMGDGESNLETLILRDDRAVLMAPYFLEEYAAELERVPAAGEKFVLASIGTHSRGALFLDGASLITPALSKEVDRFSRGVAGFHFGRYDLRVPDEGALMRGEGIRVIELNGITSEPTNMYDPKHGPLFGWASLMRQWRAIFALAKENRLAGHEPVSKREVFKLAWGHFRGAPSRDLS